MTRAGSILQIDLAGDLLNAFPAIFGVGNGARPTHEGDAVVAEIVQMQECLLNRAVMVENDVGNVVDLAVGGDGDGWNGQRELIGGRVEEEEAVDGSLDEHAGIFLDELAFPVVTGSEVEVVGRGQLLDHAAHDAGEVALAQIGREHADAHGAALP